MNNHFYMHFILVYEELSHLSGIIFSWAAVGQATHYDDYVEILLFFESSAGELQRRTEGVARSGERNGQRRGATAEKNPLTFWPAHPPWLWYRSLLKLFRAQGGSAGGGEIYNL